MLASHVNSKHVAVDVPQDRQMQGEQRYSHSHWFRTEHQSMSFVLEVVRTWFSPFTSIQNLMPLYDKVHWRTHIKFSWWEVC